MCLVSIIISKGRSLKELVSTPSFLLKAIIIQDFYFLHLSFILIPVDLSFIIKNDVYTKCAKNKYTTTCNIVLGNITVQGTIWHVTVSGRKTEGTIKTV